MCAADLAFEVTTPQVMLVLDKSGSMADNEWNDEGVQVTRWASLHGVVTDMVTSREDTVHFGATFFPRVGASDDSACEVSGSPDAGVAAYNAQAIMDVLPGADGAEVDGGTPAAVGVETALSHLLELDTDQPKMMVLVTDGSANCRDDAANKNLYDTALNERVQQAYEQEGIPTYVVGIGIDNAWDDNAKVNPFEMLNETAELGGVPREDDSASFYDVSSASALQDALDEITGGLGCEIELQDEPQNRDEVLIYIDGEPESGVESCDEDGFRWVEGAEGPTVELCGAACDAFVQSGNLQVAYSCGSV